MDRKLMGFDLEIAKPLPDGAADWKAHRPLGISCAVTMDAATMYGDGVWFGRDNLGLPVPQMTVEDCALLSEYLQDSADSGYKIVTWNGLSFDFDILSEEARDDLTDTAMLDHIDMMFMVFCARGHYLGLDKAAKGMGLSGKTAGVDGALAPQMWTNGQYRQVVEYCIQDVRTTIDLAVAIERERCLRWTSNSGKLNQIDFSHGLLTVRQCLDLPLPDTSWMKEPVSRDSFIEWMK